MSCKGTGEFGRVALRLGTDWLSSGHGTDSQGTVKAMQSLDEQRYDELGGRQ